ncbi:MAG: methyl-accepting chemotaxis protein [Candidatus Sericytochromatia bacterium]
MSLLRINISAKMALVGAALLFPIVTLLFLLVSEKNIAIDFGTKEYYGDQYLVPLSKMLESMPEHKVLDNRRKGLKIPASLDATQAAINQAMGELEAVDAKYGKDKGFLESTKRIADLKTRWNTLQQASGAMGHAQSMKAHDDLIADLRSVITYVGDYSNLILDPDLDSYYLMDVTLLKVPSMVDNMYKFQVLAEDILHRKSVTNQEKTDLTVLSGLIATDLAAIRSDHNVTYKNTTDTALKGDIEANVVAGQNAVTAMLAYIDRNILKSSSVSGAVAPFGAISKTAVEKTMAMYDTSIKGEDRLLLTRIGKFKANRSFTITWVSLLTLLILLAGGYIIYQIVKGISSLNKAALEVTEGNLAAEVNINSQDELGTLSTSFNNMVSNIRQFTIQAEEDKLALEKLVEEISEEVSNIKSDGEIVTDNAKIVSEMATTSAEFSGDGERAVSDSIEGVERIKRQIEDVAEKILELSSQTQAIGNIISTVDDIAKQSKFLAFNASIEASKVGEYGKGFAIVANEIKNLSEESKEATKKISEILNEIQGLTNTSVMLAEDATKLADAGYQLSSTAGETINKLTLSIQNSSEAAFQITSSALEQQMRLEALVGTLQAAVSSR